MSCCNISVLANAKWSAYNYYLVFLAKGHKSAYVQLLWYIMIQ